MRLAISALAQKLVILQTELSVPLYLYVTRDSKSISFSEGCLSSSSLISMPSQRVEIEKHQLLTNDIEKFL